MDVDSGSDGYMAGTRWAAECLTDSDLLFLNPILLSDFQLSMAGVDQAPTTIAVASTAGPEAPTVSNDVASTTVFDNHIAEQKKVPMSPFSADIILQDNSESTKSTKSEQNPLVSCLCHVFLAGADDQPDSASWLRFFCKSSEYAHLRWYFCKS